MFGKAKYARESINEFFKRVDASCDAFDNELGEFRRKQRILYQQEVDKGQKEANNKEKELNEGKTKKQLKKEKKEYQEVPFDLSKYDMNAMATEEMLEELRKKYQEFKGQIYEHLQWIENHSNISRYLK